MTRPGEPAMLKPDRIVSTTCPYCGVGCNLQLHIQGDTIYKVTTPFDAPVNKGNLCVKGRFGYDFVYNPHRVTTPLIRKTPQQPGSRTQAFDRSEWREVSWEEALEYVADRLVEIYQRDGARAMAAYCCAKATNEDNYLLQKMYRALFRTNHIDHCTRLCHAASVVALQMAVGSSAMSNTADEVVDNDVFILTGSNTTENHPIIALQMKAAIQKHGAKLIVADPRRIEMVDYAVLWLAQKPGTDVPLFSAMAHVILKENRFNQEFIDARTENFAEFAASMEKFTPEYAESITGVSRDKIIEAARLYAGAHNAAIYWSLGIPEHSHGTANALSLINLALLTGHIGRRGLRGAGKGGRWGGRMVRLRGRPARGQMGKAAGHEQRPVAAFQSRAENLNGPAIHRAGFRELREIMDERRMDHAIGGRRAAREAFQVLQIAAHHLDTLGRKVGGTGIGPSKPQHLMAGGEKIVDDGRPDETGGSGDKDTHGMKLPW